MFGNISVDEILAFFEEYGRTLLISAQIIGLFIAGLFRRWKMGLSLCITLIATLVWGF